MRSAPGRARPLWPALRAALAAVLAFGAGGIRPAAAAVATPFEVVPRRTSEHSSHRLAWIAAATGAVLIGASFPLANEADRRYAVYLSETDVTRIDERFQATAHMDRLASGTLLTGEGLLATAVWLRFLHPPRASRRVSLAVEPDPHHARVARCAVTLRF
jgi:hypothetical protein